MEKRKIYESEPKALGFLAQGVISIGKKQCHFFWRRGSMRKEDAFFSQKNIFSFFSIFM